MRLTFRGLGVVVLVAVTLLFGFLSGARALNAVAAPLVVALGVGVAWVSRAEEPSVSVDSPRPGFPGQTRTLRVELDGTSFASVRIPLPDGLAGEHIDETVDMPCSFERSVTLGERGVHSFVGMAVTQRDPLGLIANDVETPVPGEVVVYPPRYTVSSEALSALLADESGPERQEFERLREYVPGDPLRHVHWKSSAKHDEFLVMEFTSGEHDETVAIAAGTTDGNADEMASAAATVADLALTAERPVSLTLPDGDIPAGRGEDHRTNLLRLLAETRGGRLSGHVHRDADVSIRATDDGTTVRVGDRSHDFASLATGRVGEEVTA